MRTLVTGAQMKEIDRYTIEEIGIPSLVLMERAAFSVMEQLERQLKSEDRIWIACGTGNNGADGVAIARMLTLKGFHVLILTVGNREHGTKEFNLQLDIAGKLGITIMESSDFIPGACDVLIDAIFGVGLSRNVEGDFKAAIEMLKKQKPRLSVAVDIPSGIHSDTGQIMGCALTSHMTVTFGYEKLGTMFYPGKEYSGDVIVSDIGFPDISRRQLMESKLSFTFDKEDLRRLPPREGYSNKGTFGKVLVVAGSEGMSGAAYLSALAAYRTGAGMVKILTTNDNRQILQTLLPEAIMRTYSPQWVKDEPDEFEKMIVEECGWASVIVAGPGLGTGPHVLPLIEKILVNSYMPVILDADGLNTVAKNPYLTNYLTENIIITPHLGEMARLTRKEIKEVRENLFNTAMSYSSIYGVICVLKDAVSIVTQKEEPVYVNTSGNSCMAKAGSGDVLTGIIAGLIALGMEEFQAACLGVYLHGSAGDQIRKRFGPYHMLARELTEHLMEE